MWEGELEENKENVILGCVDTKGQPIEQASCPTTSLQQGTNVFPANLTYDVDSGKIVFSFPLTDPDGMGFGYRARSETPEINPDPFNDFENDFLTNKTIELELYPNRLLDAMEILTGKVFLKEGDTILHEGGVSIWEQDI